jgi:putative transcriptional regulator
MTLSLKGKLLIAMPDMEDTLFSRSVVFLCAKASTETMNQLEQTELLNGGPVEQHRGFVLHSADYNGDDTSLDVTAHFKLTATVDILQDMALARGPQQSLLALGYSGWSPGQLENEILHNGWLHCDADAEILFSTDWASKHRRAMEKLGVDPRMLSREAGHS